MKRPLSFLIIGLLPMLQACVDHENITPQEQKFLLTIELEGGPAAEAGVSEKAEASLYLNGEEQFTYTLGGETNELSFNGDPAETYTLIVKKEGYLPAALPFRFAGLPAEVQARNVITTLKAINKTKAFAFMPTGDIAFWIAFNQSGFITVDWGDGHVEKLNFILEENGDPVHHQLQHDYVQNPYPVIIKGDLEKVIEYGLDYYIYPSALAYINTDHLPELGNLYFNFSTVASLDLRRNKKLKHLDITENTIGHVRLPQVHRISNIAISNTNFIQKKNADAIIGNVFNNAVEYNITQGTFFVNQPVSVESEYNLQYLASALQWNVYRH